ncbi:MAG: mannose-1-phosphate guanylyltransferase [Bacillota bacterium]
MEYAVIMSGGVGSRFWPKSRKNMPKQFLRTVGAKTMIQTTVDRISNVIPMDRIYIVTNEQYINTLETQIPEILSENILIEPTNRDTATCIGLAAVHLLKKDPEAVMVVLPSDHLIFDTDDFVDTIMDAITIAKETETLVTMGIKPTRPETAYGYIEVGKPLKEYELTPVYRAKRFIEKPNKVKALELVNKGTNLWNSGMFVWKASVLMEEIKRFLPELYESLMQISAAIGTKDEGRILDEIYHEIDGISIDYGIMERSTKVLVIEADFKWDDIGGWTALERFFDKDENGNIVKALNSKIDTRDSIIFGEERLIATIGVNNLIIVDTGDVVMICDKSRDQDIKELLKIIVERQELTKFV